MQHFSYKAVVISIDAMHNEESNRKKPKKVEGRSLRKWCFAFAITPQVWNLPPKRSWKQKGACHHISSAFRKVGKALRGRALCSPALLLVFFSVFYVYVWKSLHCITLVWHHPLTQLSQCSRLHMEYFSINKQCSRRRRGKIGKTKTFQILFNFLLFCKTFHFQPLCILRFLLKMLYIRIWCDFVGFYFFIVYSNKIISFERLQNFYHFMGNKKKREQQELKVSEIHTKILKFHILERENGNY